MGASKGLHPDFGTVWEGAPNGIPFVVVGATQPMVEIDFVLYGSQSDPGPYPVPAMAPVEGGSEGTGDRHVLGEVGGLPVTLGERHLDARGAAELAQERLVVARLARRIAVRLRPVADRGVQRPVGQRDRGERQPAGVADQGHGQRPAEQRPEPGRVAAERRVDRERGDQDQRVEQRAPRARRGGERRTSPAAHGEHDQPEHEEQETRHQEAQQRMRPRQLRESRQWRQRKTMSASNAT